MPRLLALLFVLLVLPVLAACEGLTKAEAIPRGSVERVCSQPEAARRIEREKLADWGLWAACVPPGTVYDQFRLVAKGEG